MTSKLKICIGLLSLCVLVSGADAALVRTFDFEGSDTGLTMGSFASLSEDQHVTGSKSLKIATPDTGDIQATMLSGLSDSVGTVVMRLYVTGTTSDNAQMKLTDGNVDKYEFEVDYGYPSSGHIGYLSNKSGWSNSGVTVGANEWYTVAWSIEGRAAETKVYSLWIGTGTSVDLISDLIIDEASYTPDSGGGNPLAELLAKGSTGRPTYYIDQVEFYSGYGEVPEPATIGLLMLGGLFLRRRGRK